MKAFLAYPSEHEQTAREVKSFVRSTGMECWFDKDSLSAGEDWDRARRLALAAADVVLVLCSAETTGRNGVYQRELNEALELAKDRRLGTVYLIPIRIADVPLPQELSRLHYVDHFEGAWRRRLAAGLLRATGEAREEIPPALAVAAAEPDEGGVIPRTISEERPQGTLAASWIQYGLEGDYWAFVNGLIGSRALGGLYEARRQLAEWWQPTGSDWFLDISEFHRKGQLLSLTVATSSYYAGAAHPNHGVYTINSLGDEAGVITASELFGSNGDGLAFLTEYAALDLRRQAPDPSEVVHLEEYAETYGWELFEQFNFNEEGMQLNFSSASGLPHVLGFQEVYVPWQHVGQFLAPVPKRILLS